MIYFAFTDHGEMGRTSMALLDATGPEAAMTEARDALRASPGSAATHVFDGDRFVGSVEAPAFGFAGTNNTADFDASALPGGGLDPALSRTGALVATAG